MLMMILDSCDTQRSRNTCAKIYAGRSRVGDDARGLGFLGRRNISRKMS